MNNYFDLHSWSKEYLRDALREAEARHLLEETRQNGAAPHHATTTPPCKAHERTVPTTRWRHLK